MEGLFYATRQGAIFDVEYDAAALVDVSEWDRRQLVYALKQGMLVGAIPPAIVLGEGVVTSIDPATGSPVYTLTMSGTGGGELLMQDGVTSPPVPLETEDGVDWLYQG